MSVTPARPTASGVFPPEPPAFITRSSIGACKGRQRRSDRAQVGHVQLQNLEDGLARGALQLGLRDAGLRPGAAGEIDLAVAARDGQLPGDLLADAGVAAGNQRSPSFRSHQRAGSTAQLANEVGNGFSYLRPARLLQEMDALDAHLGLVLERPTERRQSVAGDQTRLSLDPQLGSFVVLKPVGEVGDDGRHVRRRSVQRDLARPAQRRSAVFPGIEERSAVLRLGKGVYYQGVIVAIVFGGDLNLKADTISAPEFKAAGSTQWIYEGRRGDVMMPYWSIPHEAFDNPDTMRHWVRLAFDAGLRARAPKATFKPRMTPTSSRQAR